MLKVLIECIRKVAQKSYVSLRNEADSMTKLAVDSDVFANSRWIDMPML